MPRPRPDRPRRVGRRRPILGDREFQLVAAAPAPKPWARRCDALWIKDANVERIAAQELRIRRNPLGIVVRDMYRANTRWDLERDVAIAPLLTGIERSAQNNISHLPGSN